MKNNILNSMCKVVLMAFAISLIIGGMAFAENTNDSGKVNINQATVKELTKLPGIGKKKAESIVAFRNEKGKFKSLDDLKKIDGIGKKTLEKIKQYLTVDEG